MRVTELTQKTWIPQMQVLCSRQMDLPTLNQLVVHLRVGHLRSRENGLKVQSPSLNS